MTNLSKAFVLHRRPYRETSRLLDIWVYDQGIVRVIAKGAKRSRERLSLDLFQPLSIKLTGKGELKSLYQWELRGPSVYLTGLVLASGFYINELLVRLLPLHDPHEKLFELYEHTVQVFNTEPSRLQAQLRTFELKLLEELGYGLNLSQFESRLHEAREFAFDLQQGWHLKQPNEPDAKPAYDVRLLAAIAREAWDQPGVLAAAKRLSREVFELLLGDKPLAARALFVQSCARV